MNGEVASDEPGRARAGALALGRGHRRRDEARVGREPEVVVRAEVHELAAAELDDGALRAAERLERAPEPLRLEGRELAVDPGERGRHQRTTGRRCRSASAARRFQPASPSGAWP